VEVIGFQAEEYAASRGGYGPGRGTSCLGFGILAALYRNSWFDLRQLATLTTISLPEFFVAYVLMLFLAVKIPVFHSLSTINPSMGFLEILQRIALPVLTLTLVIVAHMMRMTRAAIIGLLASPYIEMAQIKGISPSA